MLACILAALALARVAWVARRWQRAREAEAAERAVSRHTLMVYAGLRDGRNLLYLPSDRYSDYADAQR